MKNIDVTMGKAFMQNRSSENASRIEILGRGNNTLVQGIDLEHNNMLLHGNLIAVRFGREISLTLAGHPTQTTRARLNGILHAAGIAGQFVQRDKQQCFIDLGVDVTIDPEKWHTFRQNGTVTFNETK